MNSKTKGVRQGSFGFLVNTLTRRLDVVMKERLSEQEFIGGFSVIVAIRSALTPRG